MHVEEGESQLGIPVREIKGIGEKTEKLLAKLDIETVDQLVHHYPRCYTTYPEPISISEITTIAFGISSCKTLFSSAISSTFSNAALRFVP